MAHAIPKYQQLAAHFRRQLTRGELRPGDRLPSRNEMRAQHGASRPTVEKAHSLLEQEGWIERQHGAGIFVKSPPAQTKRVATGIVGLSGPGFAFGNQSFYWMRLMAGIGQAAAASGTPLLLLGHETPLGWEQVDGLLVSDWRATGAMRHLPQQLPRVSVLASFEGIAAVCADDFAGLRAAARHLLKLGHQRICYLHSYSDHSVVTQRIAGYRAALREAGIEARAEWLRPLHGRYELGAEFTSEACKNMSQWLRDGWRDLGCTAILCHNDEAALGVMQALQENGLRVPEDVSVVGFDGSDEGETSRPRLTTMEVPLREIGIAAFELLQAQMREGKPNSSQRVLAPRLKVRESSAALPVERVSKVRSKSTAPKEKS
jgi:GntR family transcriptional regulator of arabinose operon